MKTLTSSIGKMRVLVFLLPMFFYFHLFPGETIDYKIKGAVDSNGHHQIERILTTAETEFGPLFNLDKNISLNVHVCRDLHEFRRLTGAQWWNGGFFKNRTIYLQRLPVLLEGGLLEKTLRHEFLHFCIQKTAGRNCPLWFNEGLVLNLSGEISTLDCSPTKKEIPLPQIESDLMANNREKAKQAYCAAAFRVKKIKKKVGLQKIIQCLKRLKQGQREALRDLR